MGKIVSEPYFKKVKLCRAPFPTLGVRKKFPLECVVSVSHKTTHVRAPFPTLAQKRRRIRALQRNKTTSEPRFRPLAKPKQSPQVSPTNPSPTSGDGEINTRGGEVIGLSEPYLWRWESRNEGCCCGGVFILCCVVWLGGAWSSDKTLFNGSVTATRAYLRCFVGQNGAQIAGQRLNLSGS